MQDVQLYEQLLGLVAPWKVEAVSVKVPEQQIEVRVACQETVWGCPQCSQRYARGNAFRNDLKTLDK